MHQGGGPPWQGYQQPQQGYGYGMPQGYAPMQRQGWQCIHCGHQGNPSRKAKISTGGWIVFAVLLFACLPLCWIGLTMTETRISCPQCGARIA